MRFLSSSDALRWASFAALAALTACSSSSTDEKPQNNTQQDGGSSTSTGSDASSSSTPLSCASLSFCTSIDVAGYHGKSIVPAPAGGTLQDGLYQLAYELVGDDEYASSGGVYKSARKLDAFIVQEGRFRWVGFSHGDVGTVQSSGTKLTMTTTESCDDATGETKSASSRATTYDYTADGNGNLFLFGEYSTGNGQVRYALAYRRADRACADTVSKVPSAPGSSANCSVSNCGCTEARGGPASAATCKFVRGG